MIRFLDPFTLKKIAPDIKFENSEIRHITKLNDSYLIVGDSEGNVCFLSTATKQIPSYSKFSIKPNQPCDVTISEILILPQNSEKVRLCIIYEYYHDDS